MAALQFNAALLEVSNQLPPDQLAKLKFLCRDEIGKKDLEKIETGIKLFDTLTQRAKLGSDNRDFVCELLRNIGREDLSLKLDAFQSGPESSSDQPSEEEREKLDNATDVICENLGKTWRKLGRKLGLSEVKLESVARRFPTELDETVRELLKEWRRSQGAKAQTKDLLNALRACQYNLTADKVEDRLRSLGH